MKGKKQRGGGWTLLSGRGKKRREDSKKAPIEPLSQVEALVQASLRLFGRVLQETSDEAQEKALIRELKDVDPTLLRILLEQVLIAERMAEATFTEALDLKGQIMGLRDLHREAKRIAREHTEKIVPFHVKPKEGK